jgi:hypothetical protein
LKETDEEKKRRIRREENEVEECSLYGLFKDANSI